MAGLDPATHAVPPPHCFQAHNHRPTTVKAKVFCFFFSKKKPSFPTPPECPHAPHRRPPPRPLPHPRHRRANRPIPLLRHAVAQHRPVPRRPRACRHRRPRRTQHLLLRCRRRRRLEDHRFRRHLETHLRRRENLIHRRRRSRPLQPRTSSMSAPARVRCAATSPSATASTNPPMPAKPGPTSVCTTRARSAP